MRSIRLIARPNPYDPDELGFILKDMPYVADSDEDDVTAVDRTGLVIAHDVLEHQNGPKNVGHVWDELEALGGIWYVRGQWGDMLDNRPSYYPPAHHVASDIERMFSAWELSGAYNGPRDGRDGSRPSLWDEDFAEIISKARDMIRAEHRDIGRGDPGEDEQGWTADTFASVDEYLRVALHRMRNGFRKAQRRFERNGHLRFNGCNLFGAIRDAVADAVRHIDYEGQEFVLRYGMQEATCHEVYIPDEEY